MCLFYFGLWSRAFVLLGSSATVAVNVKEGAGAVKEVTEGCLQSESSLIIEETIEMVGTYATGSASVQRGIRFRSGNVLIRLRTSGLLCQKMCKEIWFELN